MRAAPMLAVLTRVLGLSSSQALRFMLDARTNGVAQHENKFVLVCVLDPEDRKCRYLVTDAEPVPDVDRIAANMLLVTR